MTLGEPGPLGMLFEAGRDWWKTQRASNSEKIRLLEFKAEEALQRGNVTQAARQIAEAGHLFWRGNEYRKAEAAWIKSAQVFLGLRIVRPSQHYDAILGHLVSQGIIVGNDNRGIMAGDHYLVAPAVGFGSVSTVQRIFGQDVVFKSSGRILRWVDTDRAGSISGALDVSRGRFREAVKQLQRLDAAGLRSAKILYAGDDLIVQELIHGISLKALTRCRELESSIVFAAQQSFCAYVSAAKLVGITIDCAYQNLLFDLGSHQWVAVDA